jgi:hypothetical protein
MAHGRGTGGRPSGRTRQRRRARPGISPTPSPHLSFRSSLARSLSLHSKSQRSSPPGGRSIEPAPAPAPHARRGNRLASRACVRAEHSKQPDGAPGAARLRRASRPRGPGGVPTAPAAAAAARGRRLGCLLRAVRRGGVVVPGRPRLRDRGRAQRQRRRSRSRHQVHRREGTLAPHLSAPSPSARL